MVCGGLAENWKWAWHLNLFSTTRVKRQFAWDVKPYFLANLWNNISRCLLKVCQVFNHSLADKIKMPYPLIISSQSDYLIGVFDRNSRLMTNSADPDQLASSEANWSGSTLFAKTGLVVFSNRRVKTKHILIRQLPCLILNASNYSKCSQAL